MEKVCVICGDTFHIKPSHYNKNFCCSKECSKHYPMYKLVKRLENEINEPIGTYLKREYAENQRSFRWLAKELNINNRTIRKLLSQFGIEIRHGSEAVKTQWINNEERKAISRLSLKKVLEELPAHPKIISDQELMKRAYGTDFSFVKRIAPNAIKIKCKSCNTEYIKEPEYLLHTRSCFECNKNSKGEIEVKEFLDKYRLDYEQQVKFADCKNERPLPFDFGIFKDKKLIFLIEYDGKQHFNPEFNFGGSGVFESIRKNDVIKTTYCIKKGIPLLRINSKQNVQEVLENTLKIIH